MDMETAFLQDICANPDDDALRLIFADWCEDNGQGERAEFIRLQCVRARDGEHEPGWRERELLARHELAWAAPVRRAATLAEWGFGRGFVQSVSLSGAELLARGHLLFTRAPIRHLGLMAVACQLPEIAASPFLANLTSLYLGYNGVGDVGAAALAASPYLANLTSLDLRFNGIGDEGAVALAASPNLANLTSLDLSHNRIDPEGTAALAASPNLANLSYLYLWDNDIGDEGAAALASSPYLANLTSLDLRWNHVGSAGRGALRARFGQSLRL